LGRARRVHRAPRERVEAGAMTEIANIPGLGARFRCELYRGAMSPENCAHRESLALAGDERFARCLDCSQWPDVRKPVAFKPCAAEGCRLAASPIHESGLCVVHVRERKAEKMTESPKPSSFAVSVRNANMAQAAVQPRAETTCTREGCPRPRAASPSKLEGGDGLCREHRGVLARQRKAEAKAAEPAKPAPLAAADDDVTLRVYVAPPTAEVMRARRVAAQLRAIEGVEVMSSWHDVLEEGAEEPTSYPELKSILDTNLAQLECANWVVALTRKGAGAGVYGEIGRALAAEKWVLWSVERGGTNQDFGDDRVIAAPTDDDVIRTIRNLTEWRRVA